MIKKIMVYVDSSIVGGCEDLEFSKESLELWGYFISGKYTMVLSEHTLRELEEAPSSVLEHLREVPQEHRIVLIDNDEADKLAEAYLEHGIVGPGSHSDALHVALATVSGADVLVSWNFRHIVNLGRIRLFNAVNLERGYRSIEIRSPKEVLSYEEAV